MKYLVFSDIHIDYYRRFVKHPEDRLKICGKVIDRLCEIANQNNIDHFLFLGDWFNGLGENISKVTLKYSFDFMHKLTRKKILLVSGNHDYFRDIDLLKIFKDSEELRNRFDIFSWNKYENRNSNILLGHIDLGKLINNELYSNGSLERLAESDYECILLGHYHTLWHTIDTRKGKLYFLKSVMQNSFNDSLPDGEENGCYILDTDNLSLEFIPIESPRFITMEINEGDTIDVANISQSGNYFRIKLNCKYNEEILESLRRLWNVELIVWTVEPQKPRYEINYKDFDLEKTVEDYIRHDLKENNKNIKFSEVKRLFDSLIEKCQ